MAAQPGHVRRRGRRRARPPCSAVADPSRLRLARSRSGCGSPSLFANLAEAVAEGRGKAQADSPAADPDRDRRAPAAAPTAPRRRSRHRARRSATWCVVEAGEVIPGDGDVIEGIASVDESAITGESAPVIRESGGDRSSVTGGTTVLSDRIVVRITAEPGETSSTG